MRLSPIPARMAEASRMRFVPRPGAARRLCRRHWNRGSRRITQRQQHGAGTGWHPLLQLFEGAVKRVEAEVGLTFRSLHTVEEGCHLDELPARVQEVQIQNLLACHKFGALGPRWANQRPVSSRTS